MGSKPTQAGVTPALPARRFLAGVAVTEDSKERVDRELIELHNEIRVVLPGAQVLFAFLALIAAWVVIVWYVVPLVQRRRAVE